MGSSEGEVTWEGQVLKANPRRTRDVDQLWKLIQTEEEINLRSLTQVTGSRLCHQQRQRTQEERQICAREGMRRAKRRNHEFIWKVVLFDMPVRSQRLQLLPPKTDVTCEFLAERGSAQVMEVDDQP